MRTTYVEGNIIFETGVSWVRNIGCFCDPHLIEKADEVVIGDLLVTKENKTKSFVEYMAREDVVCYGIDDGNCRFLNSPHIIIKEYRENNQLVKEFANVQLPDLFEKIRYNQLFISVMANLELFLSEIMANMVLGHEKYYNNFFEKHSEKIPVKEVLKFKNEPEQFVYNLIKKINCHQLDGIHIFFKKIFEVNLPKQEELEKKIKLRHDLVHRFGKNVEGARNIITEKDFIELLSLSESLVKDIEAGLSESILNWSVIIND